MHGSEPAKQVNYYVDVHIQDQIAALEVMFGLSREDSGARLTEYMLPYQHASNTGLSLNLDHTGLSSNLDHTTMLLAPAPPPPRWLCNVFNLQHWSSYGDVTIQKYRTIDTIFFNVQLMKLLMMFYSFAIQHWRLMVIAFITIANTSLKWKVTPVWLCMAPWLPHS